jgi:hypothetical protein
MEITFSLPHVFHPSASKTEESVALALCLEFLIGINRAYLRDHPTKSLYRSGVVYGRTVEWDSIPAVIQRGYGDCKSLSAWRIAELREEGVECRPVFRWIRRQNGRKDFHILVAVARKSNSHGVWEDPSKTLGMGIINKRW